jgi:hypothetical protein
MLAIEIPQRTATALQDYAARLFDQRKTGGDLGVLARDLLRGFGDVLLLAGLPSPDVEDREEVLVEQLKTVDIDGGGPRSAKPKQLADSVIAALEVAVVADSPATALDDSVRLKVASAISSVINAELAVPAIRERIIEEARTRTEATGFNKVTAQLDERGLALLKVGKVPVDALHAIQVALTEARAAVMTKVATIAIDAAKAVLAAADQEVAARIDLPIAVEATPREVAIRRVCAVTMQPSKVIHSLVESVGDLARIVWSAPEVVVTPYGASKTFAVGDVIDHVKFGRGTVVSGLNNKIDVEFADETVVTLVHVAAKK